MVRSGLIVEHDCNNRGWMDGWMDDNIQMINKYNDRDDYQGISLHFQH